MGSALEARVLAAYGIFGITWDFLWFVWNPAYGWARFRKGEIWWLDGAWLGRPNQHEQLLVNF